MDKGSSCEHLNKVANVLARELWQSKENLVCYDCGCPGPNLWVCLQPDCRHVGCSEGKNDHSTIHQKSNPHHCVHINVTTERIWCYICEKEVHVGANQSHIRMTPDSTLGDTSVVTRLGFDRALNVSLADDETEDLEDMEYSEDQDSRPKGLVGLQNMGNTCYMNAALQALSNSAPLTNYFLECSAAVTVLTADKKPGLSRSYRKLMRDMWNIKSRGFLIPSAILYGIRTVHPMFRGYHQHDTQEFLRCFMDQLHEELKEPLWETEIESKVNSDADGDHHESRKVHVRRRAASSGASDAPLFARMRRKSPAPSLMSDTRADGYMRIHSQSESGYPERGGSRHRRSASFTGTHYNTYTMHTTAHFNVADTTQRDAGSESELSCSSEAEDRYETCSSGASDGADARTPSPKQSSGYGASGDGDDVGGVRYRSVVSDVFDGKLLSSVQCLICDRVSTRVETFQDLSLPIPSREHLAVLRAQQPMHNHAPAHQSQDSWMWWLLSWLRSWFYGPVVSLQDCLAAFFSADELKGDNMYSCSRCNKLRNGVKTSGVVRLPEVLCVHLKRFRHELMFSSKVGARVAFPLQDLNMAPYVHKDCTSKITKYELSSVICHSGTAGGGHYTCIARNGRLWYEFDDQSVTPVTVTAVAQAEAYVLFYRKVNPQMASLRQKAGEIMESTNLEANDITFYISKQWINKFNTWAEPGPIDNSDVICSHGSVRPDRAPHILSLTVCVPQTLWEFLYANFGGGPACSHTHECLLCARAAALLNERRTKELRAFYELHACFQELQQPKAIYAISMHWFRQWQSFVKGQSPRPPPPVDNTPVANKQDIDGKIMYTLKQSSDYTQIGEELWRFYIDTYGGGPELILKSPPVVHDTYNTRSRKYSDSDREEYCTNSTSEANIKEPVQTDLHKNQSLQNIRKHVVSNDYSNTNNVQLNCNKETNGNYDTDEDMEVTAVKLENGFDSSDHDTNDNVVSQKVSDSELPNVDSISLKVKPPKSGRVRKFKRRTVK